MHHKDYFHRLRESMHKSKAGIIFHMLFQPWIWIHSAGPFVIFSQTTLSLHLVVLSDFFRIIYRKTTKIQIIQSFDVIRLRFIWCVSSEPPSRVRSCHSFPQEFPVDIGFAATPSSQVAIAAATASYSITRRANGFGTIASAGETPRLHRLSFLERVANRFTLWHQAKTNAPIIED